MDIESGVSPIDRIGGTQGYNSLNQTVTSLNTAQSQQNTDQMTVIGANTNSEVILTSDSQKDRIEKTVKHLNKIVQESNINVELEYNREADRVEIKFVDEKNNKVVKQIPSDSVLDMDVQIRKFLGLLFDKMV